MTIFAFAADAHDTCECCVEKNRHRTYTDIPPDMITPAQVSAYKMKIRTTPVAGLKAKDNSKAARDKMFRYYEDRIPRRLPTDDPAKFRGTVAVIGKYNYEIRRVEIESDAGFWDVMATECTNFDVPAAIRTHIFLDILQDQFGMKYVSPPEVKCFIVAYQCVRCAGGAHRH